LFAQLVNFDKKQKKIFFFSKQRFYAEAKHCSLKSQAQLRTLKCMPYYCSGLSLKGLHGCTWDLSERCLKSA